MTIVFFPIFIAAMAIGMPIVFALAFGPLMGFVVDNQILLFKMLPQRIFGGIDQFALLAIPMFVLAGEIMNTGGITASLVRFAQTLVGHFRAGLAQVNVVSCMLLSGITGSAVADALAIGSVLIPAMERAGYSRAFSAAITVASSVIGPIIPPSIVMIIYASMMNVSVGALFLAGFAPGIMMGVGLMVVTAFLGRRRNYPKAEKRASLENVWDAFKAAFLPLLTPVIILGGILSGMFTATESGAAACFYALFLCLFVLRTLKLSDFPRILLHTGLVSSTILLIIGAATLFAWVATISGVPQQFGQLIVGVTDSPLLFLLAVNVLLLIAGMFLDGIPIILIFGPILAPPLVQYGIDPVHFAIVMCVNVSVGLIVPPVGQLLFVGVTLTRLRIGSIMKEIIPYLMMHIVLIILISVFPAIALTLPRLLGFL